MQKLRASAFGLRWPLWVCLAAFFGLPGSVRALTLPVAAPVEALSPSGSAGVLRDGPSVWRLLNPSALASDDESDGSGSAPASPPHAGEDSPPPTGAGQVPASLPLPGDVPNPRLLWPEQGSQPASSNGGGSSRPTGGDGPTQFGLSVAPVKITLNLSRRLPADRMVLDLSEHASSVFRPPRP